jgi:hypothetical protein
MARSSCPVKRQQWVDRLRRFSDCGQTVARFCGAEGVSVPSFYNWQKKLRSRAAAHLQADSHRKSGAIRNAFQTIELVPGLSANVTIRLPNGIVIELDGDSRATERLFERALQSPVDSARGWSC